MSVSRILCSCSLLWLLACGNETNTDKLFTKLPASQTGIDFKNILKESETFNVMKYSYFYNGGGVAVGDVNNDSLPDIYFTGNLVRSHLYINKGKWQFEEIAEKAGVAASGLWNTGTTMADVNGDGWLDIYVCRSAAATPDKRRNLLFINNGAASGSDPSFTEKAESYGLDDAAYSTQASFFDYDRDGDLDMYLLNHSTQEYAGLNKLTRRYKDVMNPELGDKLFRNDGDKFTNVTEEAGIINNVLGFGLGIIVSDINDDQWPDIYISNDYNEEDYLYINQRDGTFSESLADYFGHVSLFSMGSDGADINNDLRPDIVTLDMLPGDNYRLKMSLGPENYDKYNQLINSGFYPQTMRNMLQLNNGNGPDGNPYFSEIGELAGISSTDWSWAALLADFDNDGWKDLFVSNGYMRNYLDMDFLSYVVNEQVQARKDNKEVVVMDVIEKMPSIEVENYMYKNNGATPGGDLTFTKVTEAWGLGGNSVSNGAAYADLDNDGDLDLIVNNVNAEAFIYRNNSESHYQNHYLKIHLQGKGGNTFGIGSKVYIYANRQPQYQELMPVRGFQSSVNQELVFGLGNATTIDSLMIAWPDSSAQTLFDVTANQTLTVRQTEAAYKKNEASKPKPILFQEVADQLDLDYKHEENGFLEFKRDRMLPQGISALGPKIIKGDVNNDGLEDLFLGGAKGSSGKLYKQLPNGKFTDISKDFFDKDKESEDTDALFLDVDGDQDVDLYVVSGGSENEENTLAIQDRLYLNDGQGNFTKTTDALPAMPTSGSSVSSADIDNDGDLDLFIGGRLIPGKYPLAPRSYLLKNNGKGKFQDVTAQLCPDLVTPGMVSDAQFADLNGDDLPDLVVVGEWMNVGIYINNEIEGFIRNKASILTETSGWWNTIHVDDFDKDGDQDLVLGNFGTNNHYQPTQDHPVKLAFKDFDNNGSIDPIFTYYLHDEEVFAYSRDELIGQIASLKKIFPDYESFAQSSPHNFFTREERMNTDTLVATTFETVYLQNEGNGDFSLKRLPVEAQFSPVYSIVSDDFNNDGHLDILLAGNQSDTRVSTGKFDANYGTILLGDGKGSFTHLDASQTGLTIRGDVRGIQAINSRGETYYLFSRNDDSVKVYKLLKPISQSPGSTL